MSVMGNRKIAILSGICMWLVAACDSATSIPKPKELTSADVGHYCNMIVENHEGPKAHIFEKGRSEPLWFTSVRDGLIYWTTPGEAQNPTAFYVSDMGQAEDWNNSTSKGIWIEAQKALFVINSEMRGGMGTSEAVPFGKHEQAMSFAERHGGDVVSFEEIPNDYLFKDEDPRMHEHGKSHKMQMDSDHSKMHEHGDNH